MAKSIGFFSSLRTHIQNAIRKSFVTKLKGLLINNNCHRGKK